MLISYDLVKPFKALFVSFIIVLGYGIGLISNVLVLLPGVGVSFSSIIVGNLSLDLKGSLIILFSYSLTICLTVRRGVGIGFRFIVFFILL